MRVLPYLPRLLREVRSILIIALLLLLSIPTLAAQAQTTGRIDGVVFQDLNTNTEQDPFEPGIANVVIFLRNAANQVVATTQTAANGEFSFVNLAAGIYTVVDNTPANFVSTTPDEVPVSLTAGATATVAFGNLRKTTPVLPGRGYIWGFVLNDLNANGKADPGEPGLPGVTVTLLDASGNIIGTVVTDIGTVVTDENGFYDFGIRPEGEYTVVVTPPPGTSGTTPTTIEIDVTNGLLETIIFGVRAPFGVFVPIVSRDP